VQLSLHRAPTSKFPKAGGLEAWGLAAPDALRAERKRVAVQVAPAPHGLV